MTTTDIIYLIGACCGVLGVAAWAGLILVPAWTSYGRLWERLAASFLSLYVLAAMMGVGLALGAGIVWIWDQLGGT
jgi:hypothetical protein